MTFKLSLCLALLPVLTAAYPHQEQRRAVTCSYSVVAGTGDTCNTLITDWGLTAADFEALNPGLNCPTLVVGQSYCVLGSVTTPTTTSTTSSKSSASVTAHPTTTSSSKSTTSTSSSTTSAFPYEPTQPGLVANCNKFYYVNAGDTCNTIEAKYGISFAQFHAWNPAVGSQCTTMWADYWVCVGVPGAVTTTSTPPSPTPTGPQPQMPSIVSNCNKYYLVKSGDTCAAVDSATGISFAHLLAWNPYVNSQCTNLWLGYYICVGVS